MKKIALIGLILAVAVLAGGCGVSNKAVTWKEFQEDQKIIVIIPSSGGATSALLIEAKDGVVRIYE